MSNTYMPISGSQQLGSLTQPLNYAGLHASFSQHVCPYDPFFFVCLLKIEICLIPSHCYVTPLC